MVASGRAAQDGGASLLGQFDEPRHPRRLAVALAGILLAEEEVARLVPDLEVVHSPLVVPRHPTGPAGESVGIERVGVDAVAVAQQEVELDAVLLQTVHVALHGRRRGVLAMGLLDARPAELVAHHADARGAEQIEVAQVATIPAVAAMGHGAHPTARRRVGSRQHAEPGARPQPHRGIRRVVKI